jgi:hypothetical protein
VKFGMMLLPAGWFHMISTSPPAMETCPIEQVENVVTSEPGKKKAPTVSNAIQWNHRWIYDSKILLGKDVIVSIIQHD